MAPLPANRDPRLVGADADHIHAGSHSQQVGGVVGHRTADGGGVDDRDRLGSVECRAGSASGGDVQFRKPEDGVGRCFGPPGLSRKGKRKGEHNRREEATHHVGHCDVPSVEESCCSIALPASEGRIPGRD